MYFRSHSCPDVSEAVPLRLFDNPVVAIVVDDNLNVMLFADNLGLEDSVLEVVMEHVLVRRLVFDVVQQYTCPKTFFWSLWWNSVHLTCAKRSTESEDFHD